jgi:hypothetical protein
MDWIFRFFGVAGTANWNWQRIIFPRFLPDLLEMLGIFKLS